MKYLIPLLYSALAATTASAADGTYLGTNVVSTTPRQNWSAVAGWENGIVASGAGSTATFSREYFTFSQTITNNSPLTIGSIIFTGTTQGAAYNVNVSGSNTITFDTNGNGASLLESSGYGASAILVNANVILANDLNIKSTPQTNTGQEYNTHFSVGSLSKIVNSDNNTLKTITTLQSDFSPSSPGYFRIVIAGGIDGNIALRHNSGNDLNITTKESSYYGGLYIKSGNINASGLGTNAMGAESNHVVFEARDSEYDPVGVLNFNGTITNSAYTVANQTLELQGDGRVSVSLSGTSTTITWAGLISGAGALIKQGTASLALSAQNTYTGDTIIERGTLILGINNAIQSSSNLVFANGSNTSTFSANDYSNSLGTIDLQGQGVINLGLSGTNVLAFADSSEVAWGAYTLSIVGAFIDGESIRIGTDATGLTAEQLAKITINGENAYLTGTGFLTTAIPEPAVAALLTGALALALTVRRRRD